jgi:hypothetical protein
MRYYEHPSRSPQRTQVVRDASAGLEWPEDRVRRFFQNNKDRILFAICKEDMKNARELKESPPDEAVVTYNQEVERLRITFELHLQLQHEWRHKHEKEIVVFGADGVPATFASYEEAQVFAGKQAVPTYVGPITEKSPIVKVRWTGNDADAG